MQGTSINFSTIFSTITTFSVASIRGGRVSTTDVYTASDVYLTFTILSMIRSRYTSTYFILVVWISTGTRTSLISSTISIVFTVASTGTSTVCFTYFIGRTGFFRNAVGLADDVFKSTEVLRRPDSCSVNVSVDALASYSFLVQSSLSYKLRIRSTSTIFRSLLLSSSNVSIFTSNFTPVRSFSYLMCSKKTPISSRLQG